MANPSSSKNKVRNVVPKLVELIDSVVYGDLWQRPQLSRRDRSMITIAALIAMRQTDQLRSHLEKAFDNGVSAEEISEVITHLAMYSGMPGSISAALIAKSLMEDRDLVREDLPDSKAAPNSSAP